MRERGKKISKNIFWVIGLSLTIIIPTLSAAEEFPTKPINILVGFAPGGAVDPTIRMLASKAEKFLGQPFVITNNGGGGGMVALSIVAKEKADGYHLVGCTSTGLVWVPQFQTVPYKLDDFAFIMHYGSPQTGPSVRADSPWTTLKDFVEYAKNNPWKVTYSTTGIGTPMHLAMEFIAKQEGLQWTHIPYRGNGPALTALLGGHVTAQSGGPEAIPHIKAGTIRLLATHGEKRMKIFPNVPTFRELGYDFINETVFMFAAPKGIPPAILEKLGEAFHKAMEDPEFIKLMENMEMEITYRNSADTKKYLEEAYTRLAKMIIDLKMPKEPEKK
jgi:tripartite-type tricarboxylate transporter receptor subunit TctC